MHEGHREKMRTRIENFGLDSLAEHEILETLLYFTIPRGDTNPTAHKLISTFGSLASVLEAPEEELLAVEGVGPKTARLLTMLPHYSRAYLVSKGNSDRPLSEPEAAGRYLLPYFVGESEEKVYLLCLDNRCCPICCKCVHTGSVNAVEVSIRNIVSIALSYNATAVMLAHNHPGGVAIPSPDDIATTEKVRRALEPVGIRLADHFVFAGGDSEERNLLGDFTSMAYTGALRKGSADSAPRAAQTWRVRQE
ncbi:MAG: hypothetical protein IKL89_08770 [Clostridia bacterium]|nr:hypothetical protein [Clostridia bacterium]